MPKIAFIINSLTNGGAERTISNITNNLPENYCADIIVNSTDEVVYPVTGKIISLGLKPQVNKLNILYQVSVFIKRIIILKRLKKQNRYKVVISFSESASIANILSGNRYCKIIVSVRVHLSSCRSDKLYRYIGFPLVKCLYNHADKVVAVSKGVEDDLLRNFGICRDRVITITNGCDITTIRKRSLEELLPEEKKLFSANYVITTMGRISKQKGHWHLIRALKMLKEKKVDFRLIIMGQGNEQDYLDRVISENNLGKEVFLIGFCDNPFKILKNSSIYVLPSLYEGMGNSLIEAMACGLPCISTDHKSGAREILAPELPAVGKEICTVTECEYGILTPVCSGRQYLGNEELEPQEQELAKAILRMIDNKDLVKKYRMKSLERSKNMDMKNTVRKWIEVIEN